MNMVDYASTMDLVDDVGDKVQCDLVGAWDEPELGERARALLKSVTLYIFLNTPLILERLRIFESQAQCIKFERKYMLSGRSDLSIAPCRPR